MRHHRSAEALAHVALPEHGGTGLDPELETAIYRLVQEALTNVAKHAHAQTVRLAVTADEGGVSIEVQDDGVGFDAETQSTGFGLAGMRERVYLAGGALAIESTERGTVLRARLAIPLASASAGPPATGQAGRSA